MKTITILALESAVMEAVTNPRYVFTAANNFWQVSGQPAMFNVQIAGQRKEIRLHDGTFSVHTHKLLEEVEETDLIIIPALFGNLDAALELNENVIPWLVEHYHKGTEIASLCVGAFLLASTGLLKGKQCSTHWAFGNEFKNRFPDVNLVEGGIITEDHGLYTSGGANSYWNLLLYLLEKYTDRDTAILAAKYFAIDIDRNSQSAFSIFNGQKDHNDELIQKAQNYIETHFQEKITVEQLADMLALSRRSFERRFKKATKNTVIEYTQRVKIEAAKRSFEGTRKNIYEVMFDVGYTDTKAFRSVFKKITGITPIEYRNKYNKEMLK